METVCRALVRAAELGEDPRGHLAAMRAVVVGIEAEVARAVAVTLEKLGGPFAVVEALRIAEAVLEPRAAQGARRAR